MAYKTDSMSHAGHSGGLTPSGSSEASDFPA